ncbi:uncharacterized protein LOC135823852 isoform X1 [Sycon ciliatum]|uniref:uncharacterized protein LOC135823852 isoform X1 n=1 Tax=Sycon ciliatum TaxID=27933 RepID=UPI0031F68BCF
MATNSDLAEIWNLNMKTVDEYLGRSTESAERRKADGEATDKDASSTTAGRNCSARRERTVSDAERCAKEPARFCPRCSEETNTGNLFCHQCGSMLETAAEGTSIHSVSSGRSAEEQLYLSISKGPIKRPQPDEDLVAEESAFSTKRRDAVEQWRRSVQDNYFDDVHCQHDSVNTTFEEAVCDESGQAEAEQIVPLEKRSSQSCFPRTSSPLRDGREAHLEPPRAEETDLLAAVCPPHDLTNLRKGNETELIIDDMAYPVDTESRHPALQNTDHLSASFSKHKEEPDVSQRADKTTNLEEMCSTEAAVDRQSHQENRARNTAHNAGVKSLVSTSGSSEYNKQLNTVGNLRDASARDKLQRQQTHILELPLDVLIMLLKAVRTRHGMQAMLNVSATCHKMRCIVLDHCLWTSFFFQKANLLVDTCSSFLQSLPPNAVKRLSLVDCQLSNRYDQQKPLQDAIRAASNGIKYLRISSPRDEIGDRLHSFGFLQGIRLRELTCLRLEAVPGTINDLLIPLFKSAKRLEEVRLARTGSLMPSVLAFLFEQHGSSLKCVRLRGIPLKGNCEEKKKFGMAIAEHGGRLEKFELSKNTFAFKPETWKCIFSSFQNLRCLGVSDTNVNEEVLNSLSDSCLSTLVYLDVTDCWECNSASLNALLKRCLPELRVCGPPSMPGYMQNNQFMVDFEDVSERRNYHDAFDDY